MNFLAHAHLSGNNKELLFGNFIADSVKGKQYERFAVGIQKGIWLHRHIDTFTDKHTIVGQSKQRIRNKFGLFSGIVVDIFYDHFLAANWSYFHNEELSEFSVFVYTILAHRFFLLPNYVKHIFPFMIAQNWLNAYANKADLKYIFYGMDRRTAFRSGMQIAVEVLEDNYELLRDDFFIFYPELIEYSLKQRAQ